MNPHPLFWVLPYNFLNLISVSLSHSSDVFFAWALVLSSRQFDWRLNHDHVTSVIFSERECWQNGRVCSFGHNRKAGSGPRFDTKKFCANSNGRAHELIENKYHHFISAK